MYDSLDQHCILTRNDSLTCFRLSSSISHTDLRLIFNCDPLHSFTSGHTWHHYRSPSYTTRGLITVRIALELHCTSIFQNKSQPASSRPSQEPSSMFVGRSRLTLLSLLFLDEFSRKMRFSFSPDPQSLRGPPFRDTMERDAGIVPPDNVLNPSLVYT